MARHHHRRSAGAMAVALIVALGLSVAGGPAATAAPSAPTGLHVVGNSIVDGSGKAVRLLGVDRSGSEYACLGNGGFFDGPSDAASVQAIAAWHTTAVRVPLNEDCWLGINGTPAAYSGQAYQAAIQSYVALLNQNGLVAILDLHWNAPGTQQSNGQQPMADADHAPAFWSSVASTFKSNSSVVFDLYNEPYGISWTCWRDGGSCSGASYTVAGMQSLVDAVRATGATNVIMAGGLAYANDLSQWLSYRPSDPTNNLAASWHSYNFNGCNTTACYDSQVAPVARQVPLVAGEIGENDCAHGFIDPLMGWLDAHGASYVGWAWDTYSCGGFPALITDYSGTPTAYGIGLRDHLAALAAGSPTSTPTATNTPTNTPMATNTPTNTPTATNTPTNTPTATNTATNAPTATPSPTASGQGGISVAASALTSSLPWWGEEDVTFSANAPVTALRIVVRVHKQAGTASAGQYSNFPSGALSMTESDNGSHLVYTYTLARGQTLPAGSGWRVGSQFSGTGAPHPTRGDTYSFKATSAGVTTTARGHF